VWLLPLQRYRAMLTRVRNVVAQAHLICAPSLPATLCQTPSPMLSSHQADRAMLSRVRNVVAQAHLASASARQAHPRARARRRCLPHINVIASGPAPMRNAVACALLAARSSWHAHSRAESCLGHCGQPNQRLQLTPLRVERDRSFFETWHRLDCHLDLSLRRN